MVDTGILLIWSFPLTNVKWHSATWPYTMTTPYWSDFVPNSTFYRTLIGFHRTFATGVACWLGTHTLPDAWSHSFRTCICSTCWDQSFFRSCRYFSGLCSSNNPRYFLDFAYFTCTTEIQISSVVWCLLFCSENELLANAYITLFVGVTLDITYNCRKFSKRT